MPARRIALGALAVLILLLGGGIGAGVWKADWDPAPKLALDLEGGTQVVLAASTTDGSAIDRDAMEQARQIIAQRVNAMGVGETEISVQGGTNIVVDVPGTLDQQTSDALRATAMMSFRPVLGVVSPEGTSASDSGSDVSDGGDSADTGEQSSTADETQALEDEAAAEDSGDTEPAEAADPSQTLFSGVLSTDSSLAPGDLQYDPWSLEWLDEDLSTELMEVDCTDPSAQKEANADADPDAAIVACSDDGTQKLLLGPEVVAGSGVKTAGVGAETNSTGQATGYYVVNLEFQEEAGQEFSTMTSALYNGEGATTAFAIVLDGEVISAPTVEGVSADGKASITGNFTQEQAKQLADQLKFGALPLQFDVASEQQISSTLGSNQLEMGLIAGLIGLLLVVLYAIGQYRALAIVTTTSLVVMGGLTYAVLTVLSNIPEIGYRLSLAGVAGLIVAIAFTADSFIVYFERVRDEIRDGRGIVAAVDHGWDRAKRTILASDSVNLIAAIVLYVLSTGSVRGFAFVLGVTTVLDLVIVFLFTHPILQTLVRTRFFGKGHPMSGLDPAMLGRSLPAYAGRGRIRTAADRAGDPEAGERRETLAERKARLAREQAEGTAPASADGATADGATVDDATIDDAASESDPSAPEEDAR